MALTDWWVGAALLVEPDSPSQVPARSLEPGHQGGGGYDVGKVVWNRGRCPR